MWLIFTRLCKSLKVFRPVHIMLNSFELAKVNSIGLLNATRSRVKFGSRFISRVNPRLWWRPFAPSVTPLGGGRKRPEPNGLIHYSEGQCELMVGLAALDPVTRPGKHTHYSYLAHQSTKTELHELVCACSVCWVAGRLSKTGMGKWKHWPFCHNLAVFCNVRHFRQMLPRTFSMTNWKISLDWRRQRVKWRRSSISTFKGILKTWYRMTHLRRDFYLYDLYKSYLDLVPLSTTFVHIEHSA